MFLPSSSVTSQSCWFLLPSVKSFSTPLTHKTCLMISNQSQFCQSDSNPLSAADIMMRLSPTLAIAGRLYADDKTPSLSPTGTASSVILYADDIMPSPYPSPTGRPKFQPEEGTQSDVNFGQLEETTPQHFKRKDAFSLQGWVIKVFCQSRVLSKIKNQIFI